MTYRTTPLSVIEPPETQARMGCKVRGFSDRPVSSEIFELTILTAAKVVLDWS